MNPDEALAAENRRLREERDELAAQVLTLRSALQQMIQALDEPGHTVRMEVWAAKEALEAQP